MEGVCSCVRVGASFGSIFNRVMKEPPLTVYSHISPHWPLTSYKMQWLRYFILFQSNTNSCETCCGLLHSGPKYHSDEVCCSDQLILAWCRKKRQKWRQSNNNEAFIKLIKSGGGSVKAGIQETSPESCFNKFPLDQLPVQGQERRETHPVDFELSVSAHENTPPSVELRYEDSPWWWVHKQQSLR